jgi:uncharacterized protein (TIGR00369 family)
MASFDTNFELPDVRQQNHPACFVCDESNAGGLGLEFHATRDGSVEAEFGCQPIFSGYPGMLHGGVICSLLDGAMTNCLFAHGSAAVTVDMNVRFRHPVKVECPAVVKAWLETQGPPIYRLAAELCQEGQVVANATGRFVDKQAMSWFQSPTSHRS